MRRVLLTDSVQDVLDDLVFALGDHFQVAVCRHGRDLPEMLQRFKPDILLLDLSMPGYDPEQILGDLKKQSVPIIATALYFNDYTVRLLDELGVRWLMVKPLHADGVAARLLELELDMEQLPDLALRRAVVSQLLQMGVQLRCQGFRQLTEGIVYACAHADLSVTEGLYPYVAQVCGGTAMAAEKAINRCISQAFASRKHYVWTALFGEASRTACPTNSRFITHVAHAVHKQVYGANSK